MSEILFSDERGISISKYAGPDHLAVDGDRRRYALTDMTTGLVMGLSRAQWEALGEWFTRDCSPECEGPHLDFTWDRPRDGVRV